jgi:hypothetical protein
VRLNYSLRPVNAKCEPVAGVAVDLTCSEHIPCHLFGSCPYHVAIYQSLSFIYGKRADRWLEIDSEELTRDPLAWAEAGGQVNLGYLPSRLYAAHVIRQASSLSR